MKLNEILKTLTPVTMDIWDVIDLIVNQNINLDIDYELYKNHVSTNMICSYTLYEYAVDDHTGKYQIFTYYGIPFAKLTTCHEDTMDYDILNSKVFSDVIVTLSQCIKSRENQTILADLDETDFPLLQMFDQTYNVMGENLLFVEVDGSFTKIEKYWQDPVKIAEDAKNNTEYKKLYYYKRFEIITNGIQRTVHYRQIVGVLGDSAELADKIASTMNCNDPQFKFMFKSFKFIDLDE